MRTCYLHIGTHKTGTTSVQLALNGARETLRQRGFLYPLSGRTACHAWHGHHRLSNELYDGPLRLAECESVTDLLEEIRGCNHDVIISAEGLQIAVHDRAKFSAFLERLQRVTPRIVLIVYLRDQDDYARSLYLELLKHGYSDPFDTFLSSILHDHAVHWRGMRFAFDYRELLDALPSKQGIEIVVRSYKRTRPIVADFLSIIGLNLADIGLDAEPESNPRATAATAFEFFYAYRAANPPGERIAAAAAAALNGSALDITGLSRRSILTEFDSSNRAVNARFGCDLAESSSENADIRPTRDFQLEQVFSVPAIRLLESTSKVFEAALEQIEAHATSAERARDQAVMARDAIGHERDELAAERERLVAERERLVAERDCLAQETVARQAMIDAMAHRIELRTAEATEMAHHNACARAEIGRLAAANAQLVVERDAMLASRSWRLTAPLRRLMALRMRLARWESRS